MKTTHYSNGPDANVTYEVSNDYFSAKLQEWTIAPDRTWTCAVVHVPAQVPTIQADDIYGDGSSYCVTLGHGSRGVDVHLPGEEARRLYAALGKALRNEVTSV